MPKRIDPKDKIVEYFETAPAIEAALLLDVVRGVLRRRMGSAPTISMQRKVAAQVRAMTGQEAPRLA